MGVDAGTPVISGPGVGAIRPSKVGRIVLCALSVPIDDLKDGIVRLDGREGGEQARRDLQQRGGVEHSRDPVPSPRAALHAHVKGPHRKLDVSIGGSATHDGRGLNVEMQVDGLHGIVGEAEVEHRSVVQRRAKDTARAACGNVHERPVARCASIDWHATDASRGRVPTRAVTPRDEQFVGRALNDLSVLGIGRLREVHASLVHPPDPVQRRRDRRPGASIRELVLDLIVADPVQRERPLCVARSHVAASSFPAEITGARSGRLPKSTRAVTAAPAEPS